MKIFGTSSFAVVVFSGLLASCVDPPDPKGPGNQPPPPPVAAAAPDEALLEEDETPEEREEIQGVIEGARIPNSTVREKTDSYLRPATFNLNRHKNNGRLNRATGPRIGAAGATHDQVLSKIATDNRWDIVALQEVLDEKDGNQKWVSELAGGGSDPALDVDFPKIDGYTVLPGSPIKNWYGGKIHEHCPIYYKKGGVIESCDTRDMVPTGNTKVHWAECTINNPSKRKFFFGCAHFSYAIASAEVTLIGEDIKTRVEGAAASGQKFEFILGMDANSFHTADARQKGGWDTFKALVPNATFPTFPPNSFTKVSKRNDIQNKPHYGPPNNRSNQIYDWLVFNVKDALDYVSPSLRVPPVSTQLKVPAGGNRDKKFNEAWFESFSDHLPVDALFTIKP